MTRLHTGRVTRPRYATAPHTMRATSRRHIYGELQPMDVPPRTAWRVAATILFAAALFAVLVG